MSQQNDRIRYFTGQFLRQEDFTDQQSYHVDMSHRHNKLLHTFGVMDGLELTFDEGATHLSVAPGTALDGDGQEIVLGDAKVIYTKEQDHSARLPVTIAFGEIESRPSPDAPAGGTGDIYTRYSPAPDVKMGPKDLKPGEVVLGWVTVDAKGVITRIEPGAGAEARRMAGARGGDALGIGTRSPAAPLDIVAKGGLHLPTADPRSPDNEVFFADNGQIRSHDDNHRIIFDRTANVFEIREIGDIVLSADAAGGNRTDSLVLKRSGRIGLHTASPAAVLDLGAVDVQGDKASRPHGDELNITKAILVRGVYDRSFKLKAVSAQGGNDGDAQATLGLHYSDDGAAIDAPGDEVATLRFLRGGGAPDGALAVVTQNVERLRVDKDGHVGIGITKPGSKLHVTGGIASGPFALGDAAGRISATGAVAEITFVRRDLTEYSATAQPGDRYSWLTDNVGGSGVATLWTEGGTGVLMRITADGKVGIGPGTPAAALDIGIAGGLHLPVAGSGSPDNEIFFGNNGQIRSGDDNHRIIFDRDATRFEVREFGDIILSANATKGAQTNTLFIDRSGRIGINTASPAADLDLGAIISQVDKAALFQGDDLNITKAVLTRGHDDRNFKLKAVSGQGDKDGDAQATFGLHYSSDNDPVTTPGDEVATFRFLRGGKAQDGALAVVTQKVERLRVDKDGHVGIGLSAPKAMLHVSGSIASGPLALLNEPGRISASGKLAEVTFLRRDLTTYPNQPKPGDRYGWYTDTVDGTGVATLWTEGKEDLLRITADGKVGIGTGTRLPAAPLDLGADASIGTRAVFGRSPSAADHQFFARIQEINNKDTTGAEFSSQLGIQQAGIRTSDGSYTTNDISYIKFLSQTQDPTYGEFAIFLGSSERVRVNRYGNVGIGSSSPEAPLDLGSGQENGIQAIFSRGPIDDKFQMFIQKGAEIQGQAADKTVMGIFGLRRISGDGYDLTNNAVLKFRRGGAAKEGDLVIEVGQKETVIFKTDGSVHAPNGAFINNSSDVAEMYASDVALEPGHVVILDPDADRIALSRRADDEGVIGIVSTAPGVLLNCRGDDAAPADGRRDYPVALSGRVPCRVTDENGPIRRGDRLAASSKPGYAMRSEPVMVGGVPIHRPGTLVGKALEAHASGEGTIEVFVTLQ